MAQDECPSTERRRFAVPANSKIREEQRREATLRKFVKECERLYGKN